MPTSSAGAHAQNLRPQPRHGVYANGPPAHRLLSKALKEAERHDLIARNVAATEQPPKVEREEVTILTGNQLRDLVERMKGRAMYAPAIVALFTGLRRSEVLALRWRHVDLDDKLITVRETIEETRQGLRIKPPKVRPASGTSPCPMSWSRRCASTAGGSSNGGSRSGSAAGSRTTRYSFRGSTARRSPRARSARRGRMPPRRSASR